MQTCLIGVNAPNLSLHVPPKILFPEPLLKYLAISVLEVDLDLLTIWWMSSMTITDEFEGLDG